MNSTHPFADDERESSPHRTSNGRLKNTGRELEESVVFVRVDETPVTNERVAIHIEHPDHDGGVRCFYRYGETVGRSIRRHIKKEIDADLERVELEDTVGLNLSGREILPDEYKLSGPAGLETPEVVVA
ncbi:hypothetical protein [Natronorubrum sp. FCH18a]|uniref:hypothetical protein n=1 Tax=Natronorubrum sp. FCH18a TaxID=3447018 RepID=UPI003F514C34